MEFVKNLYLNLDEYQLTKALILYRDEKGAVNQQPFCSWKINGSDTYCIGKHLDRLYSFNLITEGEFYLYNIQITITESLFQINH